MARMDRNRWIATAVVALVVIAGADYVAFSALAGEVLPQ